MALDWQRYFEDANNDFCQLILKSKIKKVEVYQKERLWRIYLSFPRILKSTELDHIAQKVCSQLKFLNRIELFPVFEENHNKTISQIIEQRKYDLIALLFGNNQEKQNSFTQNTKLTINVPYLDIKTNQEKYYEFLINQEICSKINRWFWQEYRIQLIVRAICQKQSASAAISRGHEIWITERKVESLEGNYQPASVAVPKRNKGVRRSGKVKEQPIKEKSCPIQLIEEGQRNAVVEGEIFYKEINELRDGRLAVTYFLTDYADSISIKVFYAKADEDRIKVGDWIKVKGSVRYDNFARELSLFMDTYSQEPKPIRLDEASEKRIELHAHTNMSAMDGITDVKELINRAAYWGHGAIAITDHGCVQAFPIAYAAAKNKSIKIIYGVEGYLIDQDKKEKPYHIILLAQNLTGLKNLYHLISISYIDYFYRKPKMPKQEIMKHREGLILGTACEAGELYKAILRGESAEGLDAIVDFYDYLEIQPIENNRFLLKNGTLKNEADLQNIVKQIIDLGKKHNKPVVATGDVHFLDPYQESFRTIIQAGQGYKDAEETAPLYFKTTDEMLAAFSFLGNETARWVVIDCPNLIADLIENIQPVPDGFYPPIIDSAEQEITELTWKNAHAIYGDPLPTIVQERIERELNAITKHGFSVLYLIAHKLVKKSNEDGYMVGSRGSVGSSMVAYFTGITEVNGLVPHYICPNCKYSEFINDGSIGSGVDLTDKDCPVCQHELKKDGYNIPFETFLGFEGDKVPDIDLNFSGEYQAQAHHYVEELFGSENVFRAGTISTVAEKTAFGFVKKYCEEKEINLRNAEMKRLAAGITGVRRTTGQHPGGMIVVPHDHNILEFTPLQLPADNKDSGVITTHFEYHAIEDQLVKLDILGHDGPTIIKHLEDMTGIKAADIRLDDSKTMALFSGVDSLGVTSEQINSSVGTLGIPEFGTSFVRQMLEATRPTTFSELVRICGLSHGTDVWLNNAQSLIADKTATLKEVICTRDDIMTFLIQKNMDKKQSFRIMEKVRKGKGLTAEDIEAMKACDVPQWYIDSCQKIKYMFPKAHAVAYVIMSFRIAWFKVYYPLAFYASFFSTRTEDFEPKIILSGYEQVRTRIEEINQMGYSAPQKDKKAITVLELALEMYARGFKFYPVDIYESDASKFQIKTDGLLLPFSALPNVGVSAAHAIVDSRNEAEFLSVEDFQLRSKLNKTAMEVLRKEGCFSSLPETTQINLFL